MPDPFSVAGSAVGVISLGITVAQGLINYYTAYKDRDEDIKSLITQLRRLEDTFVAVRGGISNTKNVFSQSVTSRLEAALKECANDLEALKKKSQKIKESGCQKGKLAGKIHDGVKKLGYPFKKSTLEKLKEICDELNDHLVTAMNCLQMSAHFTNPRDITSY